jgi:hypothetical protein
VHSPVASLAIILERQSLRESSFFDNGGEGEREIMMRKLGESNALNIQLLACTLSLYLVSLISSSSAQHYHPYPGIERDVISIIMKFHSTLQLLSSLGCNAAAVAHSKCHFLWLYLFTYLPYQAKVLLLHAQQLASCLRHDRAIARQVAEY